MSEIFEVKRARLFYEDNGCKCGDIGDVLSFRGVVTSIEYKDLREDAIIGFYDYKEDCYYWFYEDFDDFYLNRLDGIDCCSGSLSDLEVAMNKGMIMGTFRLTHVAHDYSLFIKKEDK